MSAQIIIQSGISSGTSYWIEKSVIRIGSDPELDISVLAPDVDPHAVTLEFRAGSYVAHNRSQNALKLGDQVMMPGESAPWSSHDRLDLGSGTELELTIDGDPRPSARPSVPGEDDQGEDDSWLDDENESDEQEKPSKSMMQMAVTLVCLLAAGMLLGSDSPSVSPTMQAPGFTSVVQAALASDTTSVELIRRLQYAQAALIRGDSARAGALFVELRDDLVKQREHFLATKREEELNILAYVNYQVGQMK